MTTKKDIKRLRNLAGKYAEIVNSDNMNKRREVWRLSNTLATRTVPFVIEDNGTFFDDLLPELQCEGKFERNIEKRLLTVITNFELIDDDRIFPPYYKMSWMINRPNMCPSYVETHAEDANGRTLGFETNHPLEDLGNSFDKLVRKEFTVDREATYEKVAKTEKIFGDILPVKIYGDPGWAGVSMASKAVNWMGMDTFYMKMFDDPESVHRFFDFVSTEATEFLQWMKDEKLITPNNGEFICGSGSYSYTDEIPKRKIKEGDAYLPEDCWGFIEAQEAAGISNDMFAEFIFPYQKKLADRFGLVYYGCCEAVHTFWPTIKQFKNMRKMTISPWCDQEIMAEAVGKDYVLSRKPHPMKLCGEKFNQDEFKEHIQETLDIAKENFVELIFRDTCTLNGTMKERVAEACKIVRTLIVRK